LAKVSEKLEELRKRLMGKFDEGLNKADNLTILQAIQTSKRIEDAGDEFKITHILSSRDGTGRLDVVWGGHLAQLAPHDARAIAWLLVEAAATAEAEESLARFLKEELEIPPEQVGSMVQAFRQHREAANEAGRGSLVNDVARGDKPPKKPH
jgi:hypothetical protein